MSSVEIVKQLCKERKIPISRLEKDLGYSNGYIGQLRKGVFPSDRLKKIADYFGVSINYLMTGKDDSVNNTETSKRLAELTERDERDIAKDLDRIMAEISSSDDGPLYYNGIEINDETLAFLGKAIEYTLQETKKENKAKRNSKKE